MGLRGPKPLPNEIKIARGTQSFRLNPAAPERLVELPTLPDHIRKNSYAHKKWVELVNDFSRLGVLSKTDATCLELLAIAYADWRGARAAMKAWDSKAKGRPQPKLTARAAWSRSVLAHTQIVKLLGELGGTPSSRGKLTVSDTKHTDDFDDFLNKRKAK